MMDKHLPHILEDGTHVFPVSELRWNSGAAFENSSGEIRWSLRDGLTFRFVLPASSGISALLPSSSKASGGSGSLHKIEAVPEWTGKLSDGTEAHLFGTIAEETGHVTTGTAGNSAKRLVAGTASNAAVTLSKDQELAFWYATEPTDRLHFMDLVLSVAVWPIKEDVEYEMGDSMISSARFILPVSSDPPLSLVRGPQSSGIWLTYEASGNADLLWYDKPCEDARGFISLLTGRWSPYLWKDTFTSESRLSRMYFGWHRLNVKRTGKEQPIPVCHGVEALNSR